MIFLRRVDWWSSKSDNGCRVSVATELNAKQVMQTCTLGRVVVVRERSLYSMRLLGLSRYTILESKNKVREFRRSGDSASETVSDVLLWSVDLVD